MSNPFYAIANKVLDLHAERNKYTKPQYIVAEVNWLSDKLLDLSSIADFLGDFAVASKIRNAAECWKQYGRKPANFPEGNESDV